MSSSQLPDSILPEERTCVHLEMYAWVRRQSWQVSFLHSWYRTSLLVKSDFSEYCLLSLKLPSHQCLVLTCHPKTEFGCTADCGRCSKLSTCAPKSRVAEFLCMCLTI